MELNADTKIDGIVSSGTVAWLLQKVRREEGEFLYNVTDVKSLNVAVGVGLYSSSHKRHEGFRSLSSFLVNKVQVFF